MSALPKLPYGIFDSMTLRRQNMAYVDKTRYLEVLEDMGNDFFFLRPRRFGKWLLINQVVAYYEVLRKEVLCRNNLAATSPGYAPFWCSMAGRWRPLMVVKHD